MSRHSSARLTAVPDDLADLPEPAAHDVDPITERLADLAYLTLAASEGVDDLWLDYLDHDALVVRLVTASRALQTALSLAG